MLIIVAVDDVAISVTVLHDPVPEIAGNPVSTGTDPEKWPVGKFLDWLIADFGVNESVASVVAVDTTVVECETWAKPFEVLGFEMWTDLETVRVKWVRWGWHCILLYGCVAIDRNAPRMRSPVINSRNFQFWIILGL